MSDAPLTSIAKKINFRGSAACKSKPKNCNANDSVLLSLSRHRKHPGSAERLLLRDTRQAHIEARYSRNNRIALAARNKEQIMQQLGRHLNRMKEALNTMMRQDLSFPHGSEERSEALKNVGKLRSQIERLTFSSARSHNIATADHEPKTSAFAGIADANELDRWLPELTENANDGEITASIGLLTKADDMLRVQRNQLKLETSAHYQEQEPPIDRAFAEFSSLLIGRELSRQPDTDLTTAQGLLKEYLN